MKSRRRAWIGILLLLVATAGCTVTFDPSNPAAKALRETKQRIAQYQIIKQEQELTRDIIALQLEVAQLKLKAQAPPVIEGEFIPKNQLPADQQ
jgi:hypothetical protein